MSVCAGEGEGERISVKCVGEGEGVQARGISSPRLQRLWGAEGVECVSVKCEGEAVRVRVCRSAGVQV